MDVRHCEPQDIEAICLIYNHYVAHTTITFEEAPVAPEAMAARVRDYTAHYPWLVCVDGGEVVGYAYASPWKARAAYRHTAEATVYVRNGLGRKGHGKALYSALLAALDQLGCHVVLGCIALPNPESVGLHEHLGFKQVAQFPEVGLKFGRWVAVGYWQRGGGV